MAGTAWDSIEGLALYENLTDKLYSLMDHIAVPVMRESSPADVLTGDAPSGRGCYIPIAL